MARIILSDTPLQSIAKMAEGNPGALTFMMEAIKADTMNLIAIIIPLDSLELYGSKAYMLWNDCCDRNIDKVKDVIHAYLDGRLTKEEIQSNLSKGRGTPFNLGGAMSKWMKQMQDKFIRLYPQHLLKAIKLDGFSHSVAYVPEGKMDHDVNTIVEHHSNFAPEQAKPDSIGYNMFNGIPHTQFQGNSELKYFNKK